MPAINFLDGLKANLKGQIICQIPKFLAVEIEDFDHQSSGNQSYTLQTYMPGHSRFFVSEFPVPSFLNLETLCSAEASFQNCYLELSVRDFNCKYKNASEKNRFEEGEEGHSVATSLDQER